MGLLQGKIENIRKDLYIDEYRVENCIDYRIYKVDGDCVYLMKECIEEYYDAEQLIKNDKWIIDTFLKDNFILV